MPAHVYNHPSWPSNESDEDLKFNQFFKRCEKNIDMSFKIYKRFPT